MHTVLKGSTRCNGESINFLRGDSQLSVTCSSQPEVGNSWKILATKQCLGMTFFGCLIYNFSVQGVPLNEEVLA